MIKNINKSKKGSFKKLSDRLIKKSLNPLNINVSLTPNEAKWLDKFLQDEYKRQMWRHQHIRDEQIVSIGIKIQNLIKKRML